MVTVEVFPGEIRNNEGNFTGQAPQIGSNYLHMLVGRAGIEPTTNGLKVRCSTKLS